MTPEDQARMRAIACDPVRRAEHDLSAMVLDLLDALDAATAGKPDGEMLSIHAQSRLASMLHAAEQRVAEQDIMIGNQTTAYEESRAETVAAEKRVAELDLACSKATAGWAEDIEKRKTVKAKLRQVEAEVATLRTALIAAEGARDAAQRWVKRLVSVTDPFLGASPDEIDRVRELAVDAITGPAGEHR